jgi:hypothetical protein
MFAYDINDHQPLSTRSYISVYSYSIHSKRVIILDSFVVKDLFELVRASYSLGLKISLN